MKKILSIIRIIGACVLIVGALCLVISPSTWLLITTAVVTGICVFLSFYLSKKQNLSKFN